MSYHSGLQCMIHSLHYTIQHQCYKIQIVDILVRIITLQLLLCQSQRNTRIGTRFCDYTLLCQSQRQGLAQESVVILNKNYHKCWHYFSGKLYECKGLAQTTNLLSTETAQLSFSLSFCLSTTPYYVLIKNITQAKVLATKVTPFIRQGSHEALTMQLEQLEVTSVRYQPIT